MDSIAQQIIGEYEKAVGRAAAARSAGSGMTSAADPSTADSVPRVTVIVPCRNEGQVDRRRACNRSSTTTIPQDRLEVLVVDGMSNDGTRQVIESFAARYPRLRLVSNEKKITPAALNLGIAAAGGSVIVRMDAHVEYPGNYISSLVKLLEQSGADNVGGVCRTLPAGDSAVAKAIAFGMSHPLGVGNSHFRIGVGGRPLGRYRALRLLSPRGLRPHRHCSTRNWSATRTTS